MQSGKRVAGAAVIELGDGHGESLPVIEPVALLAVLPQAALMMILMASDARLRKAKVGAIQVLGGNRGALRGRDMRGSVAERASQAGMFSLQHVAGFAVIEGGGRGIPADEGEILAVMLGVATGALFLAGADGAKGGVQAAPGREPAGNIAVALQAFEAGRACRQLVTTGALGGAAQRLVRPGKGAGRDLRRTVGGEQEKQNKDERGGPPGRFTIPRCMQVREREAQCSEQAEMPPLPIYTARDVLRKWTGGV